MKPIRSFVCSFLLAAALVAGAAVPVVAQQSSPPSSGASGQLSPSAGSTAAGIPSPSSSATGTGSAAAGKPGPPILGGGGWGKYMAVAMTGITVLIVLALLAGLAIQGPGFRRADGDSE